MASKKRKDINATVYGLGPDDSLNSQCSDSTDAVDTPGRESSDEEYLPSITFSTTLKWEESDYVPQFQYCHEDFARIRSISYSPPLYIRFYRGRNGARGQIGNLQNVLMSELVSCHQQQKIESNNVVIIIEDIKEDTFPFYEEGLSRILAHITSRGCSIRRCVLWMDSYYHAGMFANILSTHFTSLYELNIGAPRREDLPLPHPPPDFDCESEGVVLLLQPWLIANLVTIRCLRIYTFINLNKEYETAINVCPKLRHLTISKMNNMDSRCQFPSILSVELDKQKLAYTEDNVELLKNLTKHFPSIRWVKLKGLQFHPLTECLLISLAQTCNRKFDVFQSERNIKEKISKICGKTSLLCEASLTSSITLRHSRYNTSIVIHSGLFTFRSSL